MTEIVLTDEEYKVEYARQLLKTPKDPFKAALVLFPNNTNRALRVANEWPQDIVVRNAQNELIENEGELAFLPTKGELARSVWDRMQSEWVATDDFGKLGKLYADVMGFIEKQNTNVNVGVNVSNRVMIVKDNGNDEQWEAKLQAQQAKLIEEIGND
jgi:hypothetical protein